MKDLERSLERRKLNLDDRNVVVLKKLNESTLEVTTNNPIIYKEIESKFTGYVPGAKFTPMYKKGFWDGKIRFFNRADHTLPYGLKSLLKEFLSQRYKIIDKTNESFFDISNNDILEFIDKLNLPDHIKPLDYQIRCTLESIKHKRQSNELPTSSGKSLIIYFLVRLFLLLNKKIVLIVPKKQLVDQMYSDFESYGWTNIQDYASKVRSGIKKDFSKPLVITTWQSLRTEDRELMENFDVVISDENHAAKANVLQEIVNSAINAEFRLGFSGTLPGDQKYKSSADYFSIVGAFGPIKKYVDYDELFKRGIIAPLTIVGLIIDYPKDKIEHFWKIQRMLKNSPGSKYNEAINFVNKQEERLEIIRKLVESSGTKNSIILFSRIESQGRLLEDYLKTTLKNKEIIYIDGSTKVEDRELMRKVLENKDNIVLLASFQVFSEGINIKNIHSVILASSYKSRVKTLQSIGRGLRRLPNKKLTVIDIVDNLDTTVGNKKRMCPFTRHFKERLEIYRSNKFKAVIKRIPLAK